MFFSIYHFPIIIIEHPFRLSVKNIEFVSTFHSVWQTKRCFLSTKFYLNLSIICVASAYSFLCHFRFRIIRKPNFKIYIALVCVVFDRIRD